MSLGSSSDLRRARRTQRPATHATFSFSRSRLLLGYGFVLANNPQDVFAVVMRSRDREGKEQMHRFELNFVDFPVELLAFVGGGEREAEVKAWAALATSHRGEGGGGGGQAKGASTSASAAAAAAAAAAALSDEEKEDRVGALTFVEKFLDSKASAVAAAMARIRTRLLELARAGEEGADEGEEQDEGGKGKGQAGSDEPATKKRKTGNDGEGSKNSTRSGGARNLHHVRSAALYVGGQVRCASKSAHGKGRTDGCGKKERGRGERNEKVSRNPSAETGFEKTAHSRKLPYPRPCTTLRCSATHRRPSSSRACAGFELYEQV